MERKKVIALRPQFWFSFWRNFSIFLYGDYYIIPSSIHEVLLLKKQKGRQMEESALLRMVQEVNYETVSERDFLADSLYVYDSTGFHKVL